MERLRVNFIDGKLLEKVFPSPCGIDSQSPRSFHGF
jgi:hypothetical protein